MSSFLSIASSATTCKFRSWQNLTCVYNALPFILVRRTRLAIVASCSNPHTDIDESKNVLVEETSCRQVLHRLSNNQHVTSDGYELVQTLEISEKTGRVRGNEWTREALIFGSGGVWGRETAPFERGYGGFDNAGEIVPEEIGVSKFLTASSACFSHGHGKVGLPNLKTAPRLFECLLDNISLQQA